MTKRLEHKVAIVTGAARGIGKAIARLFAENGAIVILLDNNGQSANQLEREIQNEGGNAKAVIADVTDQKQMVSIVNKAVKEFGQIDILVANAGIAHIGNLHTTTPEDFRKVFEVNVGGVYNSMFAVIQHMRKQKHGVILNMASVAATVGIPDRFAYSMSKGAVKNMTLTVAKDYVKDNIRCNSISPARVHTPFVDEYLATNYPGEEQKEFDRLSATQPIGRMGKPDEIAKLALFLCSDEAQFITGTDFPIDGGFIKLNT